MWTSSLFCKALAFGSLVASVAADVDPIVIKVRTVLLSCQPLIGIFVLIVSRSVVPGVALLLQDQRL